MTEQAKQQKRERPAPKDQPAKHPRCYPARPHVRRGDSLYCATCGQHIMTFH